MRGAIVVACGIGIAACGGTGTPVDEGSWQAEREVIGNTTVVRTLSGSVWGTPREAVVDLSIGSAEGPEETMFGYVNQIAPDAGGGVYVYDYQVPAIRYFDADGQFIRQVGREGQGPGEYLDAVLGTAVRSDGRLQIWDARNGRVTIYKPDGSYSEQWPVSSSLFTSQAMFVDQSDHTYIKKTLERPVEGQPWKIGLLHFDDQGNLLETIPDPSVPDAPRSDGGFLSPSKQWTLARDTSFIVGMNSSYWFEIRKPDGQVVRVERDVQPLAVTDAEHAAYEERREYLIRDQGQFMTQLPAETERVKPAYRDLSADPSGRIWVRLHGPVEPDPDYQPAPEGEAPRWPFTEDKLYDVFEPDGTYLGQVHVPSDVNVLHFGLDALWGIREGELGHQYVVRMRLQPTSAGGDR
jgi:hypothetical protein